ncbi:MAG: NFACT RNA binding domain-containing protein [Clostridiales bacterium]|nr:NFACT RNA binding domain-containing protein [Clostridiales bacterium]
MAFDGFVVSNLVHDMKDKLIGGRITKISQPEKDELVLTIKNYDTLKLDISVSPSLPLMYFTEETKPAPLTAPGFCMLLRKHLNSARILDIVQPGFERVIKISIEHLNEMGDVCRKWLIIELMGKHSNIIFTDENNVIIDSIKRISAAVSSVREVLPGRTYFIPKTDEKSDIIKADFDSFKNKLSESNHIISKSLYLSYTGFSPLFANEICHISGVDHDSHPEQLSGNDYLSLYEITLNFVKKALSGEFSPCIAVKDGNYSEFSCFELSVFNGDNNSLIYFDNISDTLRAFYLQKEKQSRINQKSASLRKILQNLTERVSHKYDLQQKQIESTLKREKYKVYGELITTYGYSLPENSKELTCIDYYTGNEVTIPLDDTIPVMANAKKYFDRYAKLKRTYEQASLQLEQSGEELEYLKTIRVSLDIAENEADLNEIRKELTDFGYIKKSPVNKKDKLKAKSRPLHYVTEDGYHMYVGKNNYQNDYLTHKFATGNDWWFHAKKVPGSHVIVKCDSNGEIPDKVFETAAALAAYYSSVSSNDKVEVDYIQKKNVKRPNSALPGFVIYHTNYSMNIKPSIEGLTIVND